MIIISEMIQCCKENIAFPIRKNLFKKFIRCDHNYKYRTVLAKKVYVNIRDCIGQIQIPGGNGIFDQITPDIREFE